MAASLRVGGFFAAGCGGDTDTESISTGSLVSEDLPGLLPDADTASSALGVGIDEVEESTDLSQTFEHTAIGNLIVSAIYGRNDLYE